MKYTCHTFKTPLGYFSVALDQTGAVVATAFGDIDQLKQHLPGVDLAQDSGGVHAARDQVLAYFDGRLREFTLPLVSRGTEFQQRVWAELRRIPFGETRSYGQIAARIGSPGASRAVGSANAANPICLIVPCHRVIAAGGSLSGFAYGEDIKRRLLEHEGSLQPQPRDLMPV
jgi:methylated-DNA-[protein]-cysteine S-methyltransferase